MSAGVQPEARLLKRTPPGAEGVTVKGLRTRRLDLRSQAGFGLVEVMVSAVVVVLVATATVSSIANSQKTSARTLSRGVVANLAEADQERMRAMRATDLAGYAATQTVQQGNVTYTVDSSTRFIQTAGNTDVSCTSTGAQSRHLELTSTVRPASIADADPLTVKSLYALPVAQYSPTSGTLAVQINAADGVTGQQGVVVTISGPESRTASTNEDGCAVFQFLTPGAYNITANQTGYVHKGLEQRYDWSGTVSPGNVNQATPLEYDRAGRVDFRFDTGYATTTTQHAMVSRGVTVSQGGILSTTAKPETGFRTYPGTSSATSLFPFTGPYTAYAGICTANDPSRYQADYFEARPGYGKFTLGPGQLLSGSTAPVLREPDIVTRIEYRLASSGTGSGYLTAAGMKAWVKPTDAGCGATYPQTTTTATGEIVAEEYPFGTYSICAEYLRTAGNSSQQGTYSAVRTGVANTAFAGTGQQTIQIDTSTSSSTNTSTNTISQKATCASRGF